MHKEGIAKFIGNQNITIVDAMEKIDNNAKGILFLQDEDGRLAGCITDGDIRRWLIKTGNIKATVKTAMKVTLKYLYEEEKSRAQDVLRQYEITALPIIDNNRKILDIVLRSDLKQQEKKEEKKGLREVPVVIMAGGKGTRLYPYTKILPKPLIPIGDTPIIERIINCFTKYGIEEYYMTVNYKKGMIKSYFSDLEPTYQIKYVEETMPLGTGGSLKLIEEKFDRPLFVTNCDALILADYSEIYDYHIKADNTITIVSALKNITIPYGVLKSEENGKVVGMEEKPKLSYFINTGMYIINPEVIEKIPADTMYHMTHLVEKVMQEGGRVGMYPISEDSFLDMGEFDEMHRMEEKLNIVSETK